MPAPLRNAVTCSQTGTRPDGDGAIDYKCMIKSSDPLIAGLVTDHDADQLLVAKIVPDPQEYRDASRRQLFGGRIVKDSFPQFVTYGVLTGNNLGYLNQDSGLALDVEGFKDQQSALTFMSRAQL
jgi:hypothetical protein